MEIGKEEETIIVVPEPATAPPVEVPVEEPVKVPAGV